MDIANQSMSHIAKRRGKAVLAKKISQVGRRVRTVRRYLARYAFAAGAVLRTR